MSEWKNRKTEKSTYTIRYSVGIICIKILTWDFLMTRISLWRPCISPNFNPKAFLQSSLKNQIYLIAKVSGSSWKVIHFESPMRLSFLGHRGTRCPLDSGLSLAWLSECRFDSLSSESAAFFLLPSNRSQYSLVQDTGIVLMCHTLCRSGGGIL